jgi:hypothetical protein
VDRLVKNYQEAHWVEEILGLRKTSLAIVDHRSTPAARDEILQRYAFIQLVQSNREPKLGRGNSTGPFLSTAIRLEFFRDYLQQQEAGPAGSLD